MRTASATPRAPRRAFVLALTLLVIGGALAPWAPTRVERAAAQIGSARIAHSEDGVHLRAEPTYGAEVLGTLSEGSVVGLRIDETDTVYDPDGTTRWWPVRSDLGNGWVAGFFLDVGQIEEGTSAPAAVADGAAGSETAPAAVTERAGSLVGGRTALVADKEGVNMRLDPGTWSETVMSLSFNTAVELRIDEADTVYAEGGRWWPVRVNGQEGWIIGEYLAPDTRQAAPAPPPAPEVPAVAEAPEAAEVPPAADAPGKQAPSGPLFNLGAYVAAVTDDGTGLNMRADGAADAERVGSIPEGDVVQIMDGPYVDPTGTGWYLVTDGDVTGFVDGNWLVEASQPPAPASDPPPELQLPEAPSVADVAGVALGAFIFPLDSYTFTQSYGCSPYWFEPWEASLGCNFHNGIDLAASYYTPLMAADGGVVEYAGWCDCGLGYYVKIDHGNGFKTVYGHMAEQPWVAAGQALRRGDVIGPIGSTGNSTGPHVHFMVELNGVTVDPLGFL